VPLSLCARQCSSHQDPWLGAPFTVRLAVFLSLGPLIRCPRLCAPFTVRPAVFLSPRPLVRCPFHC
ncbi:hypothetical protein NDU88_007259, partial [Pleurodeles waltl]